MPTFEEISDYEYVSFDVFDTLIHRRTYRPIDLFQAMANADLLQAAFRGGISPKEFMDARVKAESLSRERLSHEGITETHLDQIYEELRGLVDVSPSDLDAIKNLECSMEVAAAYPNLGFLKLYNKLMAQNKVVIYSDMYLPKSVISAMLEKCGYVVPDQHFYVSNETLATKHTGEAYPFLLDKLKVDPSRILHIGDNLHSDVNNAKSHGLCAYLANSSFHAYSPGKDVKSLSQGYGIAVAKMLKVCDVLHPDDWGNFFRGVCDAAEFLLNGGRINSDMKGVRHYELVVSGGYLNGPEFYLHRKYKETSAFAELAEWSLKRLGLSFLKPQQVRVELRSNQMTFIGPTSAMDDAQRMAAHLIGDLLAAQSIDPSVYAAMSSGIREGDTR